MAVNTPCLCNREEVKRALDIRETAVRNSQVDRAIETASRNVEFRLHRKFHPLTTTYYFDWPNFQLAYPWRIWLDNKELAGTATTITSGGVNIPIANVFHEPVNSGPPFTYIEINRATSSSFGGGSTPQRSVAITGDFGYYLQTDSAGSLAAALSDTTSTTITCTDSSTLGVGNILLVDTERLLVRDQAFTTTSQTQQSGCTTAVNSDTALTVTDGTKYFVNEVLLLDSERMLITTIVGNVLTVVRAWDGSTLATHSGATINAPRLLTVSRAELGSTAATHLQSAAINVYRVPSAVKELAIAEAINSILQETSGYARTVGEGDNLRQASGSGLAILWNEAIASYGRQVRKRVI